MSEEQDQSLPTAPQDQAAAVEFYRLNPSAALFDLQQRLEASLLPLPAEPVEPDHAQLMKFYAANSMAALVDAQAKHIEKLLAKLPPTPSLVWQRVREG